MTFPGVFPGLSTDETFGRVPPRHARVHKMLVIRPRYAVSWVIGASKERSAIHPTRVYGEQAKFRGSDRLGAWAFRIGNRAE